MTSTSITSVGSSTSSSSAPPPKQDSQQQQPHLVIPRHGEPSEDYLYRLCGKGIAKRWKKRYFAFDAAHSTLLEYSSQDKKNVTKLFVISELSNISLDGLTIEFTCRNSRKVKLRGTSLEQISQWYNHLNTCVNLSPGVTIPGGVSGLSTPSRPRSGTVSPTSILLLKRSNGAGLTQPMAVHRLSLDLGNITPTEADGTEAPDSAVFQPREVASGDDDESHINHDDFDTQSSGGEDSDDETNHNTGDLKSVEQQNQARSWTATLRSLFSSSNTSEAEPFPMITPSPDPPPVPEGPHVFNLETHTVYEYDTVEVFENQRWLPISHWGTKFLLHDRAPFANRFGKPRYDWYKASLQGDGQLAADSATSGAEDHAAKPGPQVHVIRSPWEWTGPWKLAPLSSLIQTVPHNRMAASSVDESVHVGEISPEGAFNGKRMMTSSAAIEDHAVLPHIDQQWALGFDFPDFDHAIARGVPREIPPPKAVQVRTRRWVRLRRRAIQITARTPSPLPAALITPLLSFNHQEIVAGYLGFKGPAGQWRSRYFTLVKICNGLWDDGRGLGLVSQSAFSVLLIRYQSKEIQTRSRVFKLDSASFARLINKPSASDELTPSINLESRFVLPSINQQEEFVQEEPRIGRFQCILAGRSEAQIFTADTKAEAIRWVKAINYFAKEILATEASQTHPPPQPNTPKRRSVSLRFGLHHRDDSNNNHNTAHHDDLLEEEDDVVRVQLANTGENPVPTRAVLPATFEIGKLKCLVDITLPITTVQFFQTFVGNKAPFGMPEYHLEFGDTDVVASSWEMNAASEGGKENDDYDFDGWENAPERLITFKALTNSSIGPSVTRAVKKIRYWWYKETNTLVIKAATRSLDVPLGDSFLVVEVWLVQPVEDGRIRVKILMDVPFTKSSMLKGTIQTLVSKGSTKMFMGWKRKFLDVVAKASGGEVLTIKNEGGDEKEDENGDENGMGLVRRMKIQVNKVIAAMNLSWKEVVIGLWLMLWSLISLYFQYQGLREQRLMVRMLKNLSDKM